MKRLIKIQYQDKIVIEDDHGEVESVVWENEPRDSKWKSDNDPDSEYHEMMRLSRDYDFVDYDNPDLPNFMHHTEEIKTYKEKERIWEERRIVYWTSLVEEYYNT